MIKRADYDPFPDRGALSQDKPKKACAHARARAEGTRAGTSATLTGAGGPAATRPRVLGVLGGEPSAGQQCPNADTSSHPQYQKLNRQGANVAR